MRTFLSLALTLVLLIGSVIALSYEPVHAQTTGQLTVSTSPWGVNIYVDGEYAGRTTYGDTTVNGLLEGTYTLKLVAAGYKEWTKQVSITPGNTTIVYAYLEPGTSPTASVAPTATAAPRSTATPAPPGAWGDDFESYETGVFPGSGGWVLVYDGSGSSNQYVDSSHSESGTKSLHLVGSSCWSANAYHAVDLPLQVSFEAEVFIDAIVNCGCTNAIAVAALYDPNLGAWGTGYGGVRFACDGKIYAVQSYNGQYDVELGSYQARQWYHVQVYVDLVSRLFDVYINGTLYGSGLQVMDSGTPKGIVVISGHGGNPTVWFDDVRVGAATTDENTIAGSIPRLKDVPTAPATIGTDIGLGLATVLVFYLAATVFNSTVKDNYEIIQGWLGRASDRLRFRRKSFSKTMDDQSAGSQPVIRVFLEAALVAVICALIYIFLDPYFKNTLRGFSLFLSLFIGMMIATLAYEGTQVLISERRFSVPAAIRIYWIAIVVAAICVSFSRAIHFHPGLIYGFVGAYAAISISKDKRLNKRQQAMTILVGTMVIVVVSVSAFFLRELVINRWGGESFSRMLTEDILVAVIAIGLEGLVFSLAIPVAFMDGGKLRSRNFWEWFVVASIIAFIFYWIIINKDGKIEEAASNMRFMAMYVLMGLSLAISWGMWLFFWILRLRKKQLQVYAVEKQPSGGTEAGEKHDKTLPRGDGARQIPPSSEEDKKQG